MADKNIITEKVPEMSIKEKENITDMFKLLPKDTFVGIPDENIVYIGLSGAFNQQLNQVQAFIRTLFKEDEYERFMLALSTEQIKKRECSDVEKCYIILRELLFEIQFQAEGQEKNAIYSKTAVTNFMQNIDNGGEEGIAPLQFEELKKAVLEQNANEG